MPRRKGRLEIPPRGILTGPDLRQRHDAAAAARRMLRARMGLRNDALLRCRPFERAVCTTSCTITKPSPSLPALSTHIPFVRFFRYAMFGGEMRRAR